MLERDKGSVSDAHAPRSLPSPEVTRAAPSYAPSTAKALERGRTREAREDPKLAEDRPERLALRTLGESDVSTACALAAFPFESTVEVRRTLSRYGDPSQLVQPAGCASVVDGLRRLLFCLSSSG